MPTSSTPTNSSSELLSRIIGLQVVPENIHYAYGLAKLSAFVVRAIARGESVPATFTDALSSYEESAGGPLTDDAVRFEYFATTEIPYLRRTFRTLQGIDPTAGSDVRYLLLAVFGKIGVEYPADFVRNIRATAYILLSLSNYLSMSNGYACSSMAAPMPQTPLLPDDAFWDDLATSIMFTPEELFAGIPEAAIEYLMKALSTQIEALAEGDLDQIVNQIIRKPLISGSDGVIYVGCPLDLMATLRYQIVAEAQANSCLDLLNEAMVEVAFYASRKLVEPLFDGFGTDNIKIDIEHLQMQGTFDTDKELEVHVHVPPLEYLENDAFPRPFIGTFASAATGDSNGVSKRLTLDIAWPMGRDLMALSEGDDLSLFGSFNDFELMLFSPGTDQLTLWYFANALQRLGQSTQLLHEGVSAVYGLWAGNDHSFYLSDDSPPPTFMYVESDYAQELRREFSSRIGRAYVHIGDRVHEADLRHGPATTVRSVLAFPRHIFAVDIGDRTLWAELQSSSDEGGWRLHTFPEAVCYWAEVMDGYDNTLFDEFDGDIQVLIKVPENAQWDDDSWFRTGDAVAGKDLVFELRPPQPPNSDNPPNHLDRHLITQFARTLLAGRVPDDEVDQQLDALLAELAPPGERRMIHVIEAQADLIAWPGELPYARRVEPAVVAILLDSLGDNLRAVRNRSEGDIDTAQRSAVLNTEVVPFFGDELATRLTTYPGVDLLTKLISQNEALIHEEYAERTRYPSRLACFGKADNEAERLRKHLVATNTASVCSRFLIEHASAVFPAGTSQLTDEGYDMLLALASEVVNKGFLSDAIHAGISHAELSILPSGRFGISRDSDRYAQSLSSLLNSVAGQTIDEAVEAAIQRAVEESNTAHEFATAEALATIEFGFSYSQVALITSELVNLSHEAEQHDVGIIRVSIARDRLVQKFGWSVEFINTCLKELSLEPVGNFWRLGSDVMPWRYNRARSYLRRPLIRWVVDGVDTLIFGHRNVVRTSFELHGQFLSGRLKAKSPEMKEALSRARDEKGEHFEFKVEEFLQNHCGPVVRRAERFGSFDLHDINGVDLGDIDLLAFHAPTATLYVIEAKSLLVARTPRELQNEMSSLVEGDHSAVERLRGRYEWVMANREVVLAELEVVESEVTISPLIVIDSDLLSARFESTIPISTLRDLSQVFDS